MTLRGMVLIFFTAVLVSTGNLLLTRGVHKAGGFMELSLRSLIGLGSEPIFVLGFVLYVGATLLWFRVVSSEPLSIAYPVLVGLAFVFVTIGSAWGLSEPITLKTAAGLVVILSGIALAAA